jgi:hypothetical protein
MKKKKQTSNAWKMKYIYLPFTPFILKAIVEWIVNKWIFRFEFLDTVTLTITVAFLCFYVSQHLIEFRISQATNPLRKNDCEEMQGMILKLYICTIISIVFFGAIILLQALIKYLNFQHTYILTSFNIIALLAFWIPIYLSIKCQKSFKLRASYV